MYKEHPSFKSISDDTKIWRFMDFAKFCVVLEKNALFFIKPECFKDPWEGYLTKIHYIDSIYEDIPKESRDYLINATKITIPKMIREGFAVSCWHISNYESEAFWRNYSERGVVIQTTFGKLKKSFTENDYSIFIGKVEYKDPNCDVVDVGNLFNHILWKRKSFEYEQELRAVIWEKENLDGKGVKSFDNPFGQDIKINLNILIENIHTTPFEKGIWFTDIVKDMIKRYGFEFPCIKSTLMDKPL